MEKSKSSVRLYRLALDAVLVALFVVFSVYLTVKTPIAEFSLASLPILLCAFLFGPFDALCVAACGAFFEQLLTFGLSPTTVLWILPSVAQALFAACGARLLSNRKGWLHLILLILLSEVLLTAVNTATLYLDGAIMGYAVAALTVMLPGRLVNCAARAVISCLLIPAVLPRLRPFVRVGKERGRV